MPSLIKPGETNAALKTITFPIFSVDGLLATGGPDDDWESNVVATSSGATMEVQNNPTDPWTAAAGTFGHNGAGEYYYIFANAEVAGSLNVGSVAFRFTKPGFRIQTARVDFRNLDVNVTSMAANTLTASALDASAVAEIQAGMGGGVGGTLNTTASSRTITTGTGSGGVANTVGADGVYDNIVEVGGAIDMYYEFDVSATTGAMGVSCEWLGYLDDPPNSGTSVKVEARNWVGAVWDQVGTVVGTPIAAVSHLEFSLTSAHTQAGIVRIRFRNTGIASSTLKTDRILLGYAVIVSAAAIAAATAPAVWDQTRLAHVTAGTFGEGVNVFNVGNDAIDVGSFEQPTFELISQQSYLGYLAVDIAEPITRTTFRLGGGGVGMGTDALKDKILKIPEGTGYGWHAVIKSYNTATGDVVLEGTGLPGIIDATTVMAVYDSAAPAARIRDAEITEAKFSALAQKLLFGLIYDGALEAFSDGAATVADGVAFGDNVLRGCLLHVYDGLGEANTWVIAGNGGTEGRDLILVGGDAWPVDPEVQDLGAEIPGSSVCIIRFGESVGTAFDQGGASYTSGRQQLKGVAGVLLNTDGDNIGQKVSGDPEIYKDEAGATLLTSDVDATTAAKTTTWVKGAL